MVGKVSKMNALQNDLAYEQIYFCTSRNASNSALFLDGPARMR